MSASDEAVAPEGATALGDSPEASQATTGPRQPFDGEELNNSRPMLWDRTFGAAGEAAVQALMDELEAGEKPRQRARTAASRAHMLATLDAFLAGLVATWAKEQALFLAYSRNRNDYLPNRYTRPGITRATATAVADFLVSAGYVDHAAGYRDRTPNPFGGPGAFGRRSRIRARGAMLDRLASFDVSSADVRQRSNLELVRLKGPPKQRGAAKPPLDYKDTPETRKMRTELEAINRLLSSTVITLPGPMPALDATEGAEDQAQPGDQRLYRVFNNGSFNQGGRFYGGWWIGLHKADRPRLCINGEAVVELDFVALHPRLAYDLAGQPLDPDDDPYALSGRLQEVPRDLRKRAFAQLLNSSGNILAPPGVVAQLPRRVSWKEVVEGLEQRHAPIAGWFRKGRGLELQAVDACIAASVVFRMTKSGVACLPVHDSFIVPTTHCTMLEEVMATSYRSVVRGCLDRGPPPLIRLASPPPGQPV